MLKNIVLYCVILYHLIHVTFGINILIASSITSPSHYLWNRKIAFSLVEKGYNVTMIAPDKDSNPTPKNYTLIQMEGIYENLNQDDFMTDMVNCNPFQMIKAFQDWSIFQCLNYYETNGLNALINYPQDFQFDLILLDLTTGPCLVPLIELFNKPPTIAITAFLLPQYISYDAGNHLHPAYIPWYNFPYTNQMNFLQRVWNFIFYYADVLLRHHYEYRIEEETIRKKFKGNMTSWKELQRHITLVLANTDPILNYPQPLTPNIIPVGGLQVAPAKKLPQDLQTLLDKAKNGFILFSLGTNIRSDKLDQTKRKVLLDAFSQLPVMILWKFESKINNLPENVIVRKWLPQNDILGHQNIKLFFTHGGALSVQEAIYHGVPIAVMPFFVDQINNAKMVVQKGIGTELTFHKITTKYIVDKLKEVLNNRLYYNNVKKLSKRFIDQPQTPLDRAMFWIEYVLRHGDVDFLNTPARDMPFYVSSSIDVILFLILLVVSVFYIVFKIIKAILNSFRLKVKND